MGDFECAAGPARALMAAKATLGLLPVERLTGGPGGGDGVASAAGCPCRHYYHAATDSCVPCLLLACVFGAFCAVLFAALGFGAARRLAGPCPPAGAVAPSAAAQPADDSATDGEVDVERAADTIEALRAMYGECRASVGRLRRRHRDVRAEYARLAGRFNLLRHRYLVMRQKLQEILLAHFGENVMRQVMRGVDDSERPRSSHSSRSARDRAGAGRGGEQGSSRSAAAEEDG